MKSTRFENCESLQISGEDLPTARSKHSSPSLGPFKKLIARSLPLFTEYKSIPTSSKSEPSSFDKYTATNPFVWASSDSSIGKGTQSTSDSATSVQNPRAVTSESEISLGSPQRSGVEDSPGADDEMEESSTPEQSPITAPESQVTSCRTRCDRFVESATKVGIYVSLFTQIILVALFISAITMGLMYRNQCTPNDMALYVFLMGLSGLGFYVFRVVTYCYGVFYTPRQSQPCGMSMCLCLFAFVAFMALEASSLPLFEDNSSVCKALYNYTVNLNYAIIANVILTLWRYLKFFYEIFCKCCQSSDRE
ncbi:hypothetical protein TNIN_47091 [Trichonephila inaurata madagascariensis]|uniref:Uncharacterized protein n=1 Tax=Trichonephila inaurata madagascariensis TaxID=2747483 RepID=A0A8X6YF84_9ARAC|nr:hypothetical protein TNIN_47091 [Trichonephila inaurata madagascariensis]